MKILNSDFDKLYEELSMLNEDYSGVTVDMSKLDPNNLSDKNWHDIKLAAQDACIHFKQPEYKWPLQFQLQYNAYKAEELALKLLNGEHPKFPDFREKVNNLLASNGDTHRLAKHYELNSNPWSHEILGAKAINTDNTEERALSTNENTVVDIIADKEKEDIKFNYSGIKDSNTSRLSDPNVFEVSASVLLNTSEIKNDNKIDDNNRITLSKGLKKATKGHSKYYTTFETIKRIEVKCIGDATQNPKNFHNPQLVFVFNISEDSCTIYYWKNNRRVSAKDKSYKVENVRIKQLCINVTPKEEGEVTCTTW